MKKIAKEFLLRGLVSCGLGPLVLAVLYLILHSNNLLDTLTVEQVCRGIFSLAALAFVAGGMNAIYQVERLPLMGAISIHGGVLYLSYLATYLVNGWLERGWTPILAFTGIFAVGYVVIWAVIYIIIRKKTQRLNEMLDKKRNIPEEKV